MGDGMSRNLLKAGRSLTVWNRSTDKATTLKSEFPDAVAIAESPEEVIATCDLTYVMLSTPDAVKTVYEMDGGILSGISSGKCLVDCATLSTDDMLRLEAQVSERGGTFLEAPVSGSKGPAAAGELIFLAAGDHNLYSSISEDLDVMGKAKFFLGEVGCGTRMKLCVNMTMGTMMAAYGEALSLADASGLKSSELLDVLSLGVCNSPLLTLKGAKMIAGDHAPNFPLKHAEKDMRLAVDLGLSVGLTMPVAESADGKMVDAMNGYADEDFSATIEAQRLIEADVSTTTAGKKMPMDFGFSMPKSTEWTKEAAA